MPESPVNKGETGIPAFGNYLLYVNFSSYLSQQNVLNIEIFGKSRNFFSVFSV